MVRLAALATAVLVALAAGGAAGPATAARSAQGAAPRILFTDVDAGPVRGGPGGLGVPVSIYGTGLGSDPRAVRVTIGGVPAARVLSLVTRPLGASRLDVLTIQPGPRISGGALVVSVGGRRSTGSERFVATGGRVRLVAPGGVDGRPCAPAAPCATITGALPVLRPGDALLVKGPVADDEVWVRPENGGRPGRPVVIRAYPGERPVFTLSGRPVILDGSHVRFAGFAFVGGKSVGIGSESASDIRVVDNTFSGAIAYDAVGTHGTDLLIAGNTCTVSGSSQGTQGHCFYVSEGRRIRLLHNVAAGAPGYGIHVFDQERSTDDHRREIRDVLIEGNLLMRSTERSGLIVAMGDEGRRGNRIAGVTVRDNVFVANNFAGVAIGGNTSGVVVERNTFVGNGRQGVTVYDDATIDGVLVRANLFDQRPRGACRTSCSWYRPAHVEVGAGARGVKVAGNWYVGGQPAVLGGTDAAPRRGTARVERQADGRVRVLEPAPGSGFGARP